MLSRARAHAHAHAYTHNQTHTHSRHCGTTFDCRRWCRNANTIIVTIFIIITIIIINNNYNYSATPMVTHLAAASRQLRRQEPAADYDGVAAVLTRSVIAPDFSLEFAGFFPREKSRKTREKSGALRENSGKKYRIFPSLFTSETAFYPIPTNVFMYEHARHPPPGLYRPAHPHPAHPHPARPHPARPPPPGPPASTRPRSPGPLQPAPARSATCDRICPSVPNFSRVLPDFFLVPEPDFSLVPELTYCVDATLTRRAERCALASC